MNYVKSVCLRVLDSMKNLNPFKKSQDATNREFTAEPLIEKPAYNSPPIRKKRPMQQSRRSMAKDSLIKHVTEIVHTSERVSIKSICSALHKQHNDSGVRACLAQLCRQGKLRRIDCGIYQNIEKEGGKPVTAQDTTTVTMRQKIENLVNTLNVISRFRVSELVQSTVNSGRFVSACRELIAEQVIHPVCFGKRTMFFSASAMKKRNEFLALSVNKVWEDETHERKRELILKWHDVISPEEFARKYSTTYIAVIVFIHKYIVTDDDSWNSWASFQHASVIFGKFKHVSGE